MPTPDNYLELLGQYRQNDEKTPQQEVIPEKETLNFSRIQAFLDDKGITLETFDTLFKVRTAMELLSKGTTQGEQQMLKAINDGQSYLAIIGEEELIEREKLTMFSSTAEKELRRRKELNKLPMLQEAFRAYNTVRQLAKRQLTVKKKMGEDRDKQKVSVEKGLTDSVAGVIDDVKKNFSGMTPGEKAGAVGGIVLIGALLWSSSGGLGEKLKNFLWKTAKIAGVGLGANYIYKLFSGKTAIDAVSDWSQSTVGNDKFWKDTYKTDAEKAACLEKSMVYLGTKDFLDLTKRYSDAKANGQTTIPNLPGVMDKDMSPAEIFTAIDLFFSRYPIEKLERKYRNAKPPAFWSTVVSAEMTEDGRISMDGDLLDRAVTGVREIGIRGWNGFWVTEEGMGWVRALYLQARGIEPTKEEMDKIVDKLKQQLQNEVAKDSDVPSFIDKNFGKVNDTWTKNYKELLAKGKWDQNEPKVKFLEVPGDSIYVMSESVLDATTAVSEEAVSNMLKNATGQAENFLKTRYPEAADSLYKFVNSDEMRGVRVCENSTFKLFMRMPIKGNSEYNRKSARVETGGAPVSAGELFGPNDKLEYSGLNDWDKERLRIMFKLDVSQTGELTKICNWFTEEYRQRGLSRAEVVRIMLEDSGAAERALSQVQIKQNLKPYADLLTVKETELVEIEKSAAADFEGKEAFESLQAYMRRSIGYKVRLAILGDAEARGHFIKIDATKFDPKQNPDWLKALIADYTEKCKQFAADYAAGNAKIS